MIDKNVTVPLRLLKKCHLLSSNDPSMTKLLLWGNERIPGDDTPVTLTVFLRDNVTLQELMLSNCEISDRGAEALFRVLSDNTGLKKLFLGDNDISGKSMVVLSDALSHNNTLTELSLRNNKLQDSGVEALVRGLKCNSTVTKLDLGANSIGTEGAGALGELLSETKSLREVVLSNNRLGDEALAHIADGMARNQESPMETLDVENNGFGTEGATKLGKLLSLPHQSLKEVNLRGNSIGDIGAQELASGIENNPNVCPIEVLRLENTGLGCNGAKALGVVLQSSNQRVKNLVLSFNTIQDEGAIGIADGLEGNPGSVVSLDLSSNGIGLEGGVAIGKALESSTNSNLKHLRLGVNSIGDQGAAIIAQALPKGETCLDLLDLSANKIGNEGASAFSAVLSTNRQCLKELRLCYNKIREEGARLMVNDMEPGGNCCHLEILDVSENPIGNGGAASFGKMLDRSVAPGLKTLRLFAIEMDGKGIASLLGSVHDVSGSPLIVDVSENYIEDDQIDQLVTVFKDKLRLQKLRMDYCIDSVNGKRNLVRNGLKHNYYLEELSFGEIEDPILEKEAQFYLLLNAAGRRCMTRDVPTSLWPFLLKQFRDPNMTFYFLRENRDFFNLRFESTGS